MGKKGCAVKREGKGREEKGRGKTRGKGRKERG